MKSKITIDVDHDNQSVIRIDVNASEDVRDTLVQQLVKSLGTTSKWCRVDDGMITDSSKTLLIRPLRFRELKEECRLMSTWIDHQDKLMNDYNPRHQDKSRVTLDFGIGGKIENCHVECSREYEGKIYYDILIKVKEDSEPDDTSYLTLIKNVDSAFVV